MGFRGGNTPERLIQFDLVILNKSHADDFFFFLTNTFPEVYRSKFRHCCWCLSGLCTFFSGQSARSNIQLPLTQLANGVHAAECGSHPSRAPSVHCSISVCFLFRLCDILKDWHGSTRGCACVHIYINIYIYKGVCMWSSASMFMWEICVCGADVRSTCFAFPLPNSSKHKQKKAPF